MRVDPVALAEDEQRHRSEVGWIYLVTAVQGSLYLGSNTVDKSCTEMSTAFRVVRLAEGSDEEHPVPMRARQVSRIPGPDSARAGIPAPAHLAFVHYRLCLLLSRGAH